MPEALEAGTLNAHGLAGLAAGVDYVAKRGVADIAAHEAALAARLEDALADVSAVKRYGGGGDAGRAGIVALNVGELDSAVVADYLATEWDICTRAGAHCAPLMHEALGTAEQGAVRVSFSPFTTVEEVDACAEALRAAARDMA